MKGIKYIWLVGLLVGSMACSDDPSGTHTDWSGRVVRLQVGVLPQTKACLSTLDGEKVSFAKGNESTVYTEAWKAVAHASDTQLEGEYTYPEDRSYLYLRGYYPVAPLSNGRAIYYLDGQTDLLATAEQKGNVIDNFTSSDKTFYFYHLLTQCSFAIRFSKPVNHTVSLKSLKVSGTRPKASICLAEAKADTLPNVIFDGEPGTLSIYVEPGRNEGIMLSEQIQQIPRAVLVEPGAPLLLDVELIWDGSETKTYKNLPVRFNEPDKLSHPGTAYLITIQLNPPGTSGPAEVSLGVTVAQWQPGTGAGTIQ